MKKLIAKLQTEKEELNKTISQLEEGFQEDNIGSIYSLMRLIYQTPFPQSEEAKTALNILQEKLVRTLNKEMNGTGFSFLNQTDLAIRYDDSIFGYINYKKGNLSIAHDIIKKRAILNNQLKIMVNSIKEKTKEKNLLVAKLNSQKEGLFRKKNKSVEIELRNVEKELSEFENKYLESKEELLMKINKLKYFEEDSKFLHNILKKVSGFNFIDNLLGERIILDVYKVDPEKSGNYSGDAIYRLEQIFALNIVGISDKNKKDIVSHYDLTKKIFTLFDLLVLIGGYNDCSIQLKTLVALDERMNRIYIDVENFNLKTISEYEKKYTFAHAYISFEDKFTLRTYSIKVTDFGVFEFEPEFIDILSFLNSTPIQNYIKK